MGWDEDGMDTEGRTGWDGMMSGVGWDGRGDEGWGKGVDEG